MFAMAVFKLVPALEPFTLWFAIRPNVRDTSSMLYFMLPATGATSLKDSPSIPTFVLEFEDAAASTSEKWADSFASILKAESASVTISDVPARSSPEAAARSMIPPIPFSISFVFHPAIAIYSIACPDSVAVNLVVAPISLAFSSSCIICFSAAPDIASTVDICDSKDVPTFKAPVTAAVAAAPPARVADLVILVIPEKALSTF